MYCVCVFVNLLLFCLFSFYGIAHFVLVKGCVGRLVCVLIKLAMCCFEEEIQTQTQEERKNAIRNIDFFSTKTE